MAGAATAQLYENRSVYTDTRYRQQIWVGRTQTTRRNVMSSIVVINVY